ncbi:hypothetical protein COBT_000713 [Conglomerata obtusa]
MQKTNPEIKIYSTKYSSEFVEIVNGRKVHEIRPKVFERFCKEAVCDLPERAFVIDRKTSRSCEKVSILKEKELKSAETKIVSEKKTDKSSSLVNETRVKEFNKTKNEIENNKIIRQTDLKNKNLNVKEEYEENKQKAKENKLNTYLIGLKSAVTTEKSIFMDSSNFDRFQTKSLIGRYESFDNEHKIVNHNKIQKINKLSVNESFKAKLNSIVVDYVKTIQKNSKNK